MGNQKKKKMKRNPGTREFFFAHFALPSQIRPIPKLQFYDHASDQSKESVWFWVLHFEI